MNKILSIVLFMLFTLLSNSCTKITCEAFDLENETMNWHLFPDLRKEYTFVNSDSDSIIFRQVQFDKNEFEERRCHLCLCTQYLITTYQSNEKDIVLKSECHYDSYVNNWIGSVVYQVGQIITQLDIQNDKLVEFQYDEKEPEFIISNLTDFDLSGTTYDEVFQFEIIDTSKTQIQQFWFQKGSGMIGFQLDKKVYTIK